MENMEKVVYLDNAATTACAPEALEMRDKGRHHTFQSGIWQ